MLDGYWLFITALLFVASLLLHQAPLLLISLLFFLSGGVARLWGRYCLSRVTYHRRLSSKRVFWGEEVELNVEVANRKILPLFWLQTEDEIPTGVTLLKGRMSSSPKPSCLVLHNILSLSWYHKVTRSYPMRCLQRGYFTLGPARISSGDLFGFFRKEMVVSGVDNLIVYPRIVPLEKLGIPSKQPFGDIRLKRHLFQDPIMTLGVRDYHFGDSLKRIHWKTTARLGRLQTKVFDSTTNVDMGIFLDVRTVKPPLWGSVPQLLEIGIIAAASVSHYALAEGYRVGLYINQHQWSSNETAIRIPPSQHIDQRLHILETLAQIHETETMSMSQLIVREAKNLPWGSTMVVISAMPTDTLLSSLVRMKGAGRQVVLIEVGGSGPLMSKDGLTVYRIRDKVLWSEMKTIAMGAAEEISR